MLPKTRNIFLVIVLLAVAIQFIPISRSNPPERDNLVVTEPLMGLLKKSCFDCHSNETVWPWYSRVAPLSWMIAHDVSEGREHLNFSVWSRYSDTEKAKLRRELVEELSEGKMPPLQYLLAHPDARLSDLDEQLILRWAKSVGNS